MLKFLIAFFIVINCFSQSDLEQLLHKYNEETIPYISVQDLYKKRKDVILLDARRRREYNTSHIKDALFVGYKTFSLEETKYKLPNKNAEIVVYCSLGVRSEDIAEQLKKNGYTNVKNLYGGIFEWKNNNYKVVNSQEKETNKVHAYNQQWGKWLTKGEKIYE